VSKRSKRRRGAQKSGGEETTQGGRAPGAPARRAVADRGLGVQLALLVAVFAVVVLVAELAGAANLGVALGVGQIAFAIAVIYLLIRR
jgi:hypothetical protein